MEPLRRTRLQASALLLVMFIVGGLAGAAGLRVISTRQPTNEPQRSPNGRPTEPRGPRSNGPGQRRSILMDQQVLDQLNVTPEQRLKIQQTLAQRDALNKQLWDEYRPRLDSIMQQSRRELQALLTADQRTRLEEIIKEHHRRREEQRRNRDGKPDSAKKPTEK